MPLKFNDHTIKSLRFENLDGLKSADPSTYEQVRNSVFKEHDPALASLCKDMSGTILHGDLECPHDPEAKASSLDEFLAVLGEDYGDWLVITGNLTIGRSIGLVRRQRLVVLGDLHAVGVANICGELYVEGNTTIEGGLVIDSNNGGFTKLRLAAPAGFIATSSNVFDINLRSKHFFDPLFRSGFDAAPTTPHEERIQAAFGSSRPSMFTPDDLGDYFQPMSEDVAAEIRGGDFEPWLEYVAVRLNSVSLVDFLDKRQQA